MKADFIDTNKYPVPSNELPNLFLTTQKAQKDRKGKRNKKKVRSSSCSVRSRSEKDQGGAAEQSVVLAVNCKHVVLVNVKELVFVQSAF